MQLSGTHAQVPVSQLHTAPEPHVVVSVAPVQKVLQMYESVGIGVAPFLIVLQILAPEAVAQSSIVKQNRPTPFAFPTSPGLPHRESGAARSILAPRSAPMSPLPESSPQPGARNRNKAKQASVRMAAC
jgi:hypothetical protein